MTKELKFPPTVKIKLAIVATERTGIEIGSIKIHPRKITIHFLLTILHRFEPREIAVKRID